MWMAETPVTSRVSTARPEIKFHVFGRRDGLLILSLWNDPILNGL
jgi:hypothetical protein